MFILKKLLTAFIVPPGFLILVLMLSGVWQWRRGRRGPASLALVLALGCWTLSLGPVADTLTAPLEAGLTIPAEPRGDLVILLGGGIHDGVPDLTGRGAPSCDMFARMVTAIRLQRRLGVPILVSGGSVYAGRSPEAPVIRRFLLDLGVDDSQVLVEAKSRDTYENALYCREILRERGFRQPLLVTSAYHMRRSVKMFQRMGVTVTPLPAQFVTGGNRPFSWADLFPSAQAFQQTEKALKEYLGLLFYSLF